MLTLRSYGACRQSLTSIYKHCAPTELRISKQPLNKKASLDERLFCRLLIAEQFLHLCAEIGAALFEPLDHLEADEAALLDVLAGLAGHGRDQLANCHVLIFDKRLFHQHNFLIQLDHAALGCLTKL